MIKERLKRSVLIRRSTYSCHRDLSSLFRLLGNGSCRAFVCLFVCLLVCLSFCLPVCLSFYSLFTFLYFSDIDECTDGSALCEASSTVCQNNAPGYECRCKNGYRPISGEKYKCEGNVNKLFYLIIVSQ